MVHADSQAASIMMLSFRNLLAILGTLRDQEKKRSQVGSLASNIITFYNFLKTGYTIKR
jgi:hypothetical protein